MWDSGHKGLFMLMQAFPNVDTIHMSNEIYSFTSNILLSKFKEDL